MLNLRSGDLPETKMSRKQANESLKSTSDKAHAMKCEKRQQRKNRLKTAESQIKPELIGRERLLWSGRPPGGLLLRSRDIANLAIGSFILMLAAGFIATVVPNISSDEPAVLTIILGTHILSALYLAFGRLWVDAEIRSKTYYGVTDERIIIISGFFRPTLTSISLESVGHTTLSESGDGGTISFGQSLFDSDTNKSGHLRFDRIEDVRQVYEIIRSAQLQKELAAPASPEPGRRAFNRLDRLFTNNRLPSDLHLTARDSWSQRVPRNAHYGLRALSAAQAIH